MKTTNLGKLANILVIVSALLLSQCAIVFKSLTPALGEGDPATKTEQRFTYSVERFGIGGGLNGLESGIREELRRRNLEGSNKKSFKPGELNLLVSLASAPTESETSMAVMISAVVSGLTMTLLPMAQHTREVIATFQVARKDGRVAAFQYRIEHRPVGHLVSMLGIDGRLDKEFSALAPKMVARFLRDFAAFEKTGEPGTLFQRVVLADGREFYFVHVAESGDQSTLTPIAGKGRTLATTQLRAKEEYKQIRSLRGR